MLDDAQNMLSLILHLTISGEFENHYALVVFGQEDFCCVCYTRWTSGGGSFSTFKNRSTCPFGEFLGQRAGDLRKRVLYVERFVERSCYIIMLRKIIYRYVFLIHTYLTGMLFV